MDKKRLCPRLTHTLEPIDHRVHRFNNAIIIYYLRNFVSTEGTTLNNTKYKKISKEMWTLFLASNIERFSSVSDRVMKESYVCDGEKNMNTSIHLHRALPIIMRHYQMEDEIHWRDKLVQDLLPISGTDLRNELSSTIGKFTKYVFDFVPKEFPDFFDKQLILKLSKPDDRSA